MFNNVFIGLMKTDELWQTGRPTTGVYAFLATLIGFGYYEGAPWMVRLLAATVFAGLTMSIMSFNDWVDRWHDCKKGKTFASEHPDQLFRYWLGLSATTAFLVGGLMISDVRTALFCVLVWVVGLLYSYIPHWYVVQNMVVAVCSGSPALCGAIYHHELTTGSVATFLMFSSLLFINELYKDIEDVKVDSGYKVTVPIVLGHGLTILCLFALCFLPAVVMVFHPNPWVWKVGLVGLPLLQFDNAMLLRHPQLIGRPKSTLRWILKILLGVLVIT